MDHTLTVHTSIQSSALPQIQNLWLYMRLNNVLAPMLQLFALLLKRIFGHSTTSSSCVVVICLFSISFLDGVHFLVAVLFALRIIHVFELLLLIDAGLTVPLEA